MGREGSQEGSYIVVAETRSNQGVRRFLRFILGQLHRRPGRRASDGARRVLLPRRPPLRPLGGGGSPADLLGLPDLDSTT